MAESTEVVQSPDGTQIAFWRSGAGRPMVLVHGTTADHSRWSAVVEALHPHATLYVMDRRGRGASGDAPAYAVEREYEDVAAVIDEAARQSGRAVDLFGHSFGALCALGAASRTRNVRRMVLYEPVMLPNLGDGGFADKADALIAEGRRDEALGLMFRDLLGASPEEIADLRSQPSWQVRLGAAHTIAREDRAERNLGFDAAQYRHLHVPTLMLLGEETAPALRASTEAVAAALPDVRVATLPGQDHFAITRAPRLVADIVVRFLTEGEDDPAPAL